VSAEGLGLLAYAARWPSRVLRPLLDTTGPSARAARNGV